MVAGAQQRVSSSVAVSKKAVVRNQGDNLRTKRETHHKTMTNGTASTRT
jgi:hypothetical protein